MTRVTTRADDEWVERLAALFREHPAWQDAARHVSGRSTSDVYFHHRPGEVWHLERRGDETLLLRGASEDPDFVFRFSPASVERLASVSGGLPHFATTLFALMAGEDLDAPVDFRIAAPFARLVRRGYLRLLLAGGARVLAFGAARGVATPAALRRFVAALRTPGPAPWEQDRTDRKEAGGAGRRAASRRRAKGREPERER